MSRPVITAALVFLGAGLLAFIAYGRTRAEAQALRGPYLGSYAATLTTAQAAERGDSRLAGKFTLMLLRDGRYADSNPLDGAASGRFEALAAHRLRFYGDSGCEAGGFERALGGIYSWTLHRGRLVLRLVNEGACSGRTTTLTFPVWIRSEPRDEGGRERRRFRRLSQ